MLQISTKGRYAVRVMLDLAQHSTGSYQPLADIAARQAISEKYLEAIMAVLSKAGLVAALRGKGGGYRLNRSPEEYTVGAILRLTEGSLAPVACLSAGSSPCPRASICHTVKMWRGFYELTEHYFDGITLADLLLEEPQDNYTI